MREFPVVVFWGTETQPNAVGVRAFDIYDTMGFVRDFTAANCIPSRHPVHHTACLCYISYEENHQQIPRSMLQELRAT